MADNTSDNKPNTSTDGTNTENVGGDEGKDGNTQKSYSQEEFDSEAAKGD
jgi:hypothetical protein